MVPGTLVLNVRPSETASAPCCVPRNAITNADELVIVAAWVSTVSPTTRSYVFTLFHPHSGEEYVSVNRCCQSSLAAAGSVFAVSVSLSVA